MSLHSRKPADTEAEIDERALQLRRRHDFVPVTPGADVQTELRTENVRVVNNESTVNGVTFIAPDGAPDGHRVVCCGERK